MLEKPWERREELSEETKHQRDKKLKTAIRKIVKQYHDGRISAHTAQQRLTLVFNTSKTMTTLEEFFKKGEKK